tara:strand:- start:238 stop:471 length:234 start_codon:yes stop_codon:yes gene_type:complete
VWNKDVAIKCGVTLENDPKLARVTTKEELKEVCMPHSYDIKTQEQGIYYDKVVNNAKAKLDGANSKLLMEYVGNLKL